MEEELLSWTQTGHIHHSVWPKLHIYIHIQCTYLIGVVSSKINKHDKTLLPFSPYSALWRALLQIPNPTSSCALVPIQCINPCIVPIECKFNSNLYVYSISSLSSCSLNILGKFSQDFIAIYKDLRVIYNSETLDILHQHIFIFSKFIFPLFSYLP